MSVFNFYLIVHNPRVDDPWKRAPPPKMLSDFSAGEERLFFVVGVFVDGVFGL